MSDAARFWDARAREDAWHFVDNRMPYRRPDVERFWAGGEADLDALLAAAGVAVARDDVVLDLGCGLGRLTRPLAARARAVQAIDVSGEMLARARELNADLDNVTWLHGSGRDLAPVADASVDAVVSHVVFQHIPDPRVTLGYVREMGRVLRPGGWAAFQVSTDPPAHRWRIPARRRVLALLGRAPRGQRHPEWLGAAVDLGDLRATATDAGLVVERVAHPGTQYCAVGLRRGTG
jgi:SAM-dependent methyltransferase